MRISSIVCFNPKHDYTLVFGLILDAWSLFEKILLLKINNFSANECLTHTDTDWKSFDQTRMQCHPTYIMLEVPRCAFEIANFPFAGVTVGDKPSIWPEIPDDHEYRQCKGYVLVSWI